MKYLVYGLIVAVCFGVAYWTRHEPDPLDELRKAGL